MRRGCRLRVKVVVESLQFLQGRIGSYSHWDRDSGRPSNSGDRGEYDGDENQFHGVVFVW